MKTMQLLLAGCLLALTGCAGRRQASNPQAVADTVQTVQEDTVLRSVEDSLASGQKLGGRKFLSEKELDTLHEEVWKRLRMPENKAVRANVSMSGVGLQEVTFWLVMNTPERRKEFREKIMDAPCIRFEGSDGNEPCTKVGTSDTLGIRLEPFSPSFPAESEKAFFALHNWSGMKLTYGARYSLACERNGRWYVLPLRGSFVDLGYVLSPGDSATFEANLLPDVHPNKPGRYRYFKEINVGESRRKILMMAEFRLK